MKKLLFLLASIAMVSLVAVSFAFAFAPEHAHDYTSEITKEATCDNDGEITYTCSCGDDFVIKLGATGHSFTNYVSDNNATCTEDGTKTAKCDNCDATKTLTENNTAKGHTPAEAVQENVVNASCADDGSYESVVYCANGCGFEYSRETVIVEATGEHVYATETERVDATCTEDGYVVKACGCGATETTTLDATGHSYGAPAYEWNDDYTACVATITCANDASHAVTKNGTVTFETTAATCKEAGKTVYTATFEGEGYATQTAEVDIPTLAHTSATLSAVAPTCIYTGLTEGSYCSACGEILVAQTVVAATGAAHAWDGTSCTTCGATKFEGETSDITCEMLEGVGRVVSTGREGKTLEATNYPSGDSFVYYMSSSLTTTLKFYVNASKAGKATISICMGRATYDAYLENLLYVQVNGTKVESYPDVVFPKYSTTNYYDWCELVIADVELQAGDNVVELIKPIPEDPANSNSARFGLNFDYMAIRSVDPEMIIQDTREKNYGHSYTVWEGDNLPDYDNAGSASAYCDYCRALKTVDLPKVSEANGYTKLSYGVKSVWEYTTADGVKVTVEVAEPAKKYSYILVNPDDVLFTDFVDNNGETDGTTQKNNNKYGTFYEHTQGATFTLKVNASQATEAIFVLVVRGTNTGAYAYSDIMKSISVTAGGQTTAGVINEGSVVTSGWYPINNTPVEIATINLAAGENVITFTMGSLNLNITGVEFNAFADITNDTADATYGGYIADFDPFIAENGGSVTPGTGATAKTAPENANGVYYEKNNTGATFTITVTVDKDMDVILSMGMTSTNKKVITTDAMLSSVTSKTSAGVANTVVRNSMSVTYAAWSAYTDTRFAEYATISLKEGTNTITFVFGSTNANIAAVYLQGAEGLVFGTKEN